MNPIPLSILLFLFSPSIFSQTADSQKITKKNFIFLVDNSLKPPPFSDVEQWYRSTLQTLDSESRNADPANLLHVYRIVFHGFSATLTVHQARKLQTLPHILAVFPDRTNQLHTTRSPHFLGLDTEADDGEKLSELGSDVIIGILDTGIWPERLSFDDSGLGPIHSKWKGECSEGENFPKSTCNKKLIGARYFTAGYNPNATYSLKSARDTIGHGTHTASTAAGAPVTNASFFGFAKGNAVGMAPKARIAVYKVCWERGCMDSDILAGFDAAVNDGVDIISVSLGSSRPLKYDQDIIAIASFGAMERGVFVSTSAGNAGSTSGTVINTAPWITTVGAGTIDRKFPADLLLEDGTVLTGSSLYSGKSSPEFLPLVYPGIASNESFITSACVPGSLDRNLTHGKIVVCDRGLVPRVMKGIVANSSGGVGVVVPNVPTLGEGLSADSYLIPGLDITDSGRTRLANYIKSAKNPRAKLLFNGTQVGSKPAPLLASFSSRGPNLISIYVLKPDIFAPGVNILAGWPDDVSPSGLSQDLRHSEYNIKSGTSMSCPHVSGLVAIIKGAHPNWSTAAAKSALMTTAYTVDLDGKPILDEKDLSTSNYWAMGSGHVDIRRAIDPGLVYNLTVDNYLDFLCASNLSMQQMKVVTKRGVNCSEAKKVSPWDLNYPAISVAIKSSKFLDSEIMVTRMVTHVYNNRSKYTVEIISNMKGVTVSVEPETMEFTKAGEEKSYIVRIRAEKDPPRPTMFPGFTSEYGYLNWSDGKHKVTSPILVNWI